MVSWNPTISLSNSHHLKGSTLCLVLLGLRVQDTSSENDEHTIFTWKTSSPTEVKNHDLPLVGFSHNSLNGWKSYNVIHTVTLCNTHVTSLTLRPSRTSNVTWTLVTVSSPRQVTRHHVQSLPRLGHTQLTYEREMNKINTLLLCLSTQASVRYNMLLICQWRRPPTCANYSTKIECIQ